MLECPKCGSRYLHPSRTRRFSERIKKIWFVSPVRCLDCKTRFLGRTFSIPELRFARCPRCFRMDLNTWMPDHFTAPFQARLKLRLGGHRWRCEYCRLSFVSLRKRKEVFSFRRWGRYQERAEGPGLKDIQKKDMQKTMPTKNAQGLRHD